MPPEAADVNGARTVREDLFRWGRGAGRGKRSSSSLRLFQVPKLNTKARELEGSYKDFKRTQIQRMVLTLGRRIARRGCWEFSRKEAPETSRRKNDCRAGKCLELYDFVAPDRLPQIYDAESNAHRRPDPLVSFPPPNAIIR
eukprot:766044-Hanusia_phi.AAC.9